MEAARVSRRASEANRRRGALDASNSGQGARCLGPQTPPASQNPQLDAEDAPVGLTNTIHGPKVVEAGEPQTHDARSSGLARRRRFIHGL